MPAQRNQRSTRGNGGNGNGRRKNRAASRPVEPSLRTAIGLVVEGQNGDTFAIDSRTTR